MSAVLKFEVAATWLECANCGIAFGITGDTERRLRESHENFYCPKGHCNVYNGLSEAERVRRQMQTQLDSAANKIEWLRGEAEAAKRNAESAKRQAKVAKTKLTKMKNRVEAGVCPHCNRTFKQLAQHMQSKHSEEIHAEETKSA